MPAAFCITVSIISATDDQVSPRVLSWEGTEPVEVTASREGSIPLSSFTETRPGVRVERQKELCFCLFLFTKVNTVVKKMHYF